MLLVERHRVTKDHPRFASIDAAAFASKNLYNQANYQIRQAFIHEGTYLPYGEVYHRLKHMDFYQALPAKVANSILILLHKNWIAFFAAREAYHADPSTFTGRPKLPKYKDKVKGRNILIYDTQALGKRFFRKTGKLVPSGLPIEIETCITEWRQVAQVRIVPRLDGYIIEVVYEQQEEQAEVDQKLVAALDLGVNVLAALTSTKPGFVTGQRSQDIDARIERRHQLWVHLGLLFLLLVHHFHHVPLKARHDAHLGNLPPLGDAGLDLDG